MVVFTNSMMASSLPLWFKAYNFGGSVSSRTGSSTGRSHLGILVNST
jgi:hypothetical protein